MIFKDMPVPSSVHQAPPPTGRDAPGKWGVLATVVAGVWMIVLDSTVMSVAFPTLQRTFAVGPDAVQWVLSVYVLALGVATPVAGSVADRFGIKRVYIGALCTFVLGSIMSGLAPSLGALIASRAVQGIGGGIAQPLGVAMLFIAFPPGEQGRAFGIFGLAMVAAPALGPILGGVLVDRALWRWIFLVNVPVGALAIALARWLLPRGARGHGDHRPARLSPVAIGAVVIGFGCVLYGASTTAREGWRSATVLAPLATGAAVLVVFAIAEARGAADPLLDLRLFQDRTFLTANVAGWVAVIALFGAEFLMPVYLQALRGRTALASGMILLPLAIASGIVSPIAGRLYDEIGPRVLVGTGCAVLLRNAWALAHLGASTPTSHILVLMAERGLAIGLIMQATFTTAMGAVPRARMARGSSLVSSTRFIAQALGVAILSTVLAGACSDRLTGLRHAYMLTFWVTLVACASGLLLPGWPGRWLGRGNLSTDHVKE